MEIEWSLSVLLLVSLGVRDWLPWLCWIPAANGWELCSSGNLAQSKAEYTQWVLGGVVAGALGYGRSHMQHTHTHKEIYIRLQIQNVLFNLHSSHVSHTRNSGISLTLFSCMLIILLITHTICKHDKCWQWNAILSRVIFITYSLCLIMHKIKMTKIKCFRNWLTNYNIESESQTGLTTIGNGKATLTDLVSFFLSCVGMCFCHLKKKKKKIIQYCICLWPCAPSRPKDPISKKETIQ